jgi:hypothetical protein
MKHTIPELIAIAYRYFPRGKRRSDPEYKHTPEFARQMEARVPASARFRDWRALLHRIQERFPPERFPDLNVENGSLFLQLPDASTIDRCFTGTITIPVHGLWEESAKIEFLVSFVVPYYTIYRSSLYYVEGLTGPQELEGRFSFDFTAEEAPLVEAIEQEIRADFPDHELMPPQVGTTLVPEVEGGNELYGRATIFGCLLSDEW